MTYRFPLRRKKNARDHSPCRATAATSLSSPKRPWRNRRASASAMVPSIAVLVQPAAVAPGSQPPDQIGFGIGDQALDREAPLAPGHDVRATVWERRHADDASLGPDRARIRRRADLLARPDQHHAERTSTLDRALHQDAITRLEDMQRQQRTREKDRREGEQREQFGHAVNGTLGPA